MTRHELAQIADDDRAFRERVLIDLTEIKTQRRADCDDIDGLKRVVYGPTGADGVATDVAMLKDQVKGLKRLKTFNQAMVVVQILLGAILAALGWGKIKW